MRARQFKPLHAPDLVLVEQQIRCSHHLSSPSFFAQWIGLRDLPMFVDSFDKEGVPSAAGLSGCEIPLRSNHEKSSMKRVDRILFWADTEVPDPQPVNLNAQFYYNAITPETEDGTRVDPEWTLRVVFQLLFPKG